MSKEKTQRNDPCPCGSKKEDGTPKKYKHCCWNKDQISKQIPPIPLEILEKMIDYQKYPAPFGKGGALVGRRPVDLALKNEQVRMRAVANRIYRRPLGETFQIFLLNIFADLLGRKWYEEQTMKSKNDWHPMFNWVVELKLALNENNSNVDTNVSSVELTGGLRALLAIAYDIYSLQHCGTTILPKMIKRLKDPKLFQGARYEIAVGGIVARSGFKIEWFSENDKGKHCEFIGTHTITGEKIAFEAKSHHRDGVLGKPGDFDAEKSKVKILDHVREAIEQSPKDIPLVIFDDLNLPISEDPDLSKRKWFDEIDQQMQYGKFFGNDNKTQYGALIITNFSWHFHSKVPQRENEVVTYFHVGKKFSLKQETIKFLIEGTKQYGFVPERLEELEDLKSDDKVA